MWLLRAMRRAAPFDTFESLGEAADSLMRRRFADRLPATEVFFARGEWMALRGGPLAPNVIRLSLKHTWRCSRRGAEPRDDLTGVLPRFLNADKGERS